MPSRSLNDCAVDLELAWHAVYDDYKAARPGHDLLVTCTHRPVKEQQALYAIGRTTPGRKVTQLDGVKLKSKHNAFPAHALDFAVLLGGKVTWDDAEYAVVGEIAKRHGLIWGGDWKTLHDAPHLELPL